MHKFNRLLNDPFFKNNPENETLDLDVKIPGRPPESFRRNVLMPNFCPFENIPSHFRAVVNTGISHINELAHFGVVFQCPSCQRYCVIDYLINGTLNTQVQPYKYSFIHPNLLFSSNEFKELSLVSPNFKDIYIQSAEAEYYGLNHVYIMGYRRALEYLVTGYLIKFKGLTKKQIDHKTLGKEINNLDDKDLKSTARVVSYIGNDHTHVYNKDPELGSYDLKQALKAFSYLIMMKITIYKDNKIANNNKK